ncbi:hypothetical protein [Micromonospora coxensis]|uniref:Uncharacterized protein n=1 Tax=Micromonospora coxensis TaxID=356852 RepID=A0A1C5JDL9_9ACTN|nr:hypothetical protein [Micromonospora coxensis]SCG68650.1 hypothetical protein GA0070614_4422 [Micromonospora coxensis]
MQQLDPYQFIRTLASSPAGAVWSGTDVHGLPVTVAQLDATVAGHPGWREAFTNAAATVRYERPDAGEVASDFTAPTPWVAYTGDNAAPPARIFQLLGVELTASPAPAEAAGPESAASAATPPAETGPQQDSSAQLDGNASPTSGAPVPVSGVPVSTPPPSVSAPPYAVTMPFTEIPPLMAQPVQHTEDVDTATREPRIKPSPPRQRRTGLWVAVSTLVLALLVGGGYLLAANVLRNDPGPRPTPTNAGGTTSALPSAEATTAQPASPGAEPPRAGAWPAAWPRFQENDGLQTLTGLEGIDFPIKVPQNWQCTPSALTQTSARYYCGLAVAGEPKIGGELIVRDCPLDCTQEQQAAMRKSEEAWNLQWVRSGRYSCYAESSSLEIDGERRYGLVVVAYWRGGTDGKLNRQMVFRMTAPVDGANQLRRVANYLRGTLIF